VTAGYLEDDGLETAEVRAWAEEKYRIVGLYDRLFSTGMKKKWDCRVYIDLYSAAGHARIKGTQKIIRGSPLIALNIPDPFDKYILCEKNPKLMKALKQRVSTGFPAVDVSFIPGDCNEKVGEILSEIPPHSKKKTVLSFCFVDPFNIGIQFETIRALTGKIMDFLIVLAVGMDATRNEVQYADPENAQIDRFLGNTTWRVRWTQAQKLKVPFRHFLAQEYADQMAGLGYIKVGVVKMKEVKSDERNLPLYHLAFFSKSKRGYTFWEEVLKYTDPQQSLNF
jgi:three-Cys-motif partner protein